jgi:hypothetical protein
MQISEMTESEQVLCFKMQDELVDSRTMDESTAKQYAALCIARARAYADRIASMTIPMYVSVWASEMAAKTGKSLVKAHHNYLPWIAAFLVSRYGEAVDFWPDTLSEQDFERAREWKRQGLPKSFNV